MKTKETTTIIEKDSSGNVVKETTTIVEKEYGYYFNPYFSPIPNPLTTPNTITPYWSNPVYGSDSTTVKADQNIQCWN